MVNAVSSESGKRQEQNVAVDAMKPCPATVALFGALIEQQP